MMSVVHPAYHCDPNGGHGSFWPSASRRLSCVLVLATAAGSRRAVSSAFLPNHTSPGGCHNIHVLPLPPAESTESAEEEREDQNSWSEGEARRTFGGICDCYQQKNKVSKLVHECDSLCTRADGTHKSRCHQPGSPPGSTAAGSGAAASSPRPQGPSWPPAQWPQLPKPCWFCLGVTQVVAVRAGPRGCSVASDEARGAQ